MINKNAKFNEFTSSFAHMSTDNKSTMVKTASPIKPKKIMFRESSPMMKVSVFGASKGVLSNDEIMEEVKDEPKIN